MPKVRIKPKTVVVKSKKLVQKNAQLEVKIGLMMSNGEAYRDESIEEMIEKFREFVRQTWPERHNLTVVGNYYIIDGKVCRPEDFDRETMDRKPGTLPPSWSLAGDDKKDALLAERNAEQSKRVNSLAKQPENLVTSKEMDELAKVTTRKTTIKAAGKTVGKITPAKKAAPKKLLKMKVAR